MNFISGTRAVSLFPRATLTRGISYVARSLQPPSSWLRKYRRRGYKIIHKESAMREKNTESIGRMVRRTDDSLAWTINFPGCLGVLHWSGVHKAQPILNTSSQVLRSSATSHSKSCRRIVVRRSYACDRSNWLRTRSKWFGFKFSLTPADDVRHGSRSPSPTGILGGFAFDDIGFDSGL